MARLIDTTLGHREPKAKIIQAIKKERVPQTWLFAGPSGVGKKRMALAVTQALTCEKDNLGCGVCPPCLRVESGQSENLLLVQTEGLQIKVDKAREILEFFSLKLMGRARVVIIDEAQKMNTQTANALLKLFEEPPENSHFILTAASASGLLTTIRSRSQILRFGILSEAELRQVYKGKDWVIRACGGQLDMAEQLGEWTDLRQQAFQAWEPLLSGQAVRALETLRDHVKNREEALVWARFWQQILRDAILVRENSEDLIHQDQWELADRLNLKLTQHLESIGLEALDLEKDLKANIDRQLAFEKFVYRVQGALATQ